MDDKLSRYFLSRYGMMWQGPETPVSVPMPDGYWTPWHTAQERIERLQRERDEALSYLARLLTSAHPDCEPMKNLLDLCTQIDNAITGVRLERDEALAELARWRPGHNRDDMHHAHIRAPIGEDWHGVLDALMVAVCKMQDFEDTRHTVIVGWVRYSVDLDAENGNPPNVYEVRAALGGDCE